MGYMRPDRESERGAPLLRVLMWRRVGVEPSQAGSGTSSSSGSHVVISADSRVARAPAESMCCCFEKDGIRQEVIWDLALAGGS